MNTLFVNGKSYQVIGNNISIINGKIKVNGKVIEEGVSGIVELKFEGDLANLETSGSATIKGNVQGNVSAGGSVTCKDVGKDVDAGGSVSCGNIQGNIDAGGSVSAKWVKQ